MEAYSRIILALDFSSPDLALETIKVLDPYVGCFKIGLELIHSMRHKLLGAKETKEAHRLLDLYRELHQQMGPRQFTDAKLDDIPNTVGGASVAISGLGPLMFNIHASAGSEAMMAAVEKKGSAMVMAVTVLTSREENDGHLTFGSPTKAKVLQFARDAKLAGCDGVICSPQELKLIRSRPELKDLLTVVPGIRPADSAKGDQKRVMTPGEAIKAGADYLVIGRPITGADDPVAAAQAIAQEIAEALKQKEV